MQPVLARTKEDVQTAVGEWRAAGASIGFVPTMGALHEGHVALVRAARAGNDRVVVSIFVNPTQFNSASDLAAYPRREAGDVDLLVAAGVDLVYLPAADEMYPTGFATAVEVAGISEGLCGAFRPGHFRGVATVVTKLLLQVAPDRAYFGEKDFQQLRVIQTLVQDLDIPVEVKGVATVRESDGLALSSRNLRLSPEERQVAAGLPRALFHAADRIGAGAAVPEALEEARHAILDAGFREVEYLELRSARTLAPLAGLTEPARLLAAAWVGEVRLIDNVPLAPQER